jgi:hypothetical protein
MYVKVIDFNNLKIPTLVDGSKMFMAALRFKVCNKCLKNKEKIFHNGDLFWV